MCLSWCCVNHQKQIIYFQYRTMGQNVCAFQCVPLFLCEMWWMHNGKVNVKLLKVYSTKTTILQYILRGGIHIGDGGKGVWKNWVLNQSKTCLKPAQGRTDRRGGARKEATLHWWRCWASSGRPGRWRRGRCRRSWATREAYHCGGCGKQPGGAGWIQTRWPWLRTLPPPGHLG